ncbi:MAG: hypothetical protein EPN85_06300 [Bacteroidetes bacterium]|nr:MAG: hypothetical protein EPN85_06300 [Bacteroidota bacterium]
MNESYISYKNIAEHLPIQEGDVLVISSDITKLIFSAKKNEEEFNAIQFINSFINKVGQTGTILIPAYNFFLKSGQTFDIKNTLPLTGLLATEALKHPEFKRTQNPLHSFAVWGHHQKYLCDLDNNSSFGKDSPFAFMYEQKAKALLIHLGIHDAFTFVHYVEEQQKVPYRKMRGKKLKYINEMRELKYKKYHLYEKLPGYVMDFHSLEKMFDDSQLIHKTSINNIQYLIIPIRDTYEIIKKDILENNAKSFKYFSFMIFVKEIAKSVLYRLGLYQSISDKINNISSLSGK